MFPGFIQVPFSRDVFLALTTLATGDQMKRTVQNIWIQDLIIFQRHLNMEILHLSIVTS